MAGTLLQQEIYEIPDCLETVLSETPPAVAALLDELAQAGPIGRVWLVGNGTSLHAALGAAELYQRWATPSGPPVTAVPAHLFATQLPQLAAADLVVGISVSGESTDVASIAQATKGVCRFVAVTNIPASTLAEMADGKLWLHSGELRVPSTTKTYVTSLAALYVLVLALLERQDATPPGLTEALGALPGVITDCMAAAEVQVESLLPAMRRAKRSLIYGAGPLYPLTLEIALKVKEMACVQAEGIEMGELLHGAIAVIDPDTVVLGFHQPGQDVSMRTKIERTVHRLGGVFCAIDFAHTSASQQAASVHPWLTPFLWCVPGYLLGRSMALARGLEPDRPDWYELYLAETR